MYSNAQPHTSASGVCVGISRNNFKIQLSAILKKFLRVTYYPFLHICKLNRLTYTEKNTINLKLQIKLLQRIFVFINLKSIIEYGLSGVIGTTSVRPEFPEKGSKNGLLPAGSPSHGCHLTQPYLSLMNIIPDGLPHYD